MKDWWKIFSPNLDVVQKQSKGNDLLDYPLNIINNPHVDINSKLSCPRSSNLVKFKWFRDIYFTISLELSHLGLKVNLGNIGTINKTDRVILSSRLELTRNQSIKPHKREETNYLYNLKNLNYKFGSQMSKLYKNKNIKSKRKFD